jgi:hypothetical protein
MDGWMDGCKSSLCIAVDDDGVCPSGLFYLSCNSKTKFEHDPNIWSLLAADCSFSSMYVWMDDASHVYGLLLMMMMMMGLSCLSGLYVHHETVRTKFKHDDAVLLLL